MFIPKIKFDGENLDWRRESTLYDSHVLQQRKIINKQRLKLNIHNNLITQAMLNNFKLLFLI